jgi:hypothetical protein
MARGGGRHWLVRGLVESFVPPNACHCTVSGGWPSLWPGLRRDRGPCESVALPHEGSHLLLAGRRS